MNWRTWSPSLLVFLLSACTAAPPPAASPPTVAPGAAPTAASSAQWDSVVAAAKQEGKVVVVGTTTDPLTNGVASAMQSEYGISVEYVGPSSREHIEQIQTERQANQFNWDVWVDGTTSALTSFIPMKAFDPLPPALVLDEVKNPGAWRGGAPEYLDDQQQVLVMTPFQRGTIYVNPTLARAEDFTSYKDLLDPKWKGKLLIDDPRAPGPGFATFLFFYMQPDLGPNFIRALAQQEPQISRDWGQEVDMLGQGRVPVLIGGVDAIVEQRISQGVPIAIVDPHGLKEGSDVSPANGALALFNRAPHPNAAKVFINWLLSKEGQTAFTAAQGYVSSRLDVPLPPGAEAWRVPAPGAIKSYNKQALDNRDALNALLSDALAGR